MKRQQRPTALSLVLVSVFCTAAAVAGVDDYPTAIPGCYHTDANGNEVGPSFTGDLKDSVQDSLVDPWNEYNRECTSFAAFRLSSRNGFTMPFNDYARGWGAKAQARGYTVNSTPAVGAIAWWSDTAIPPYGHVAWVEAINGSSVTIEDYNYGYPSNPGLYREHTISVNSVSGYIHFKDITGLDTDIWVNAGAGSGGNGSQGSPYNTVLAAVNRANATQAVTIHITPGVYGEKISTSKHIHFVTNGSGTVRIGG